MLNFNLKTEYNMKTKKSIYHRTFTFAYVLLCLVLFSSCSGQIVVWNMKDIIVLSLLGLIIVVVAILFIIAWIQDNINAWKRKRKKN
jgi:Ca2+/Na+ antiporter